MCGFAGLLDPAKSMDPARHAALARAMAQTLIHRGPDDEGVWTDPAAGFAVGFRRLAIIDLSPEGHQPMLSADKRYVIAFNGEIYNFRRIRAELDRETRIPWRGHSDTEVLLEAIARWGPKKTLARANGMFAFVLWDRQERRLTIARDRMGEKPLYYGALNGAVVFASELKALKQHPHWNGEIDRGAISLYLRHAYVPAPFSAYRGIFKLPPGHALEIADDRFGAPEAYWSAQERADAAASEPFSGSENDAVEALDRLILDAVGLRLEADVPIGAFLSGGIDSSTVAAAMQAKAAGRIKTFSIGFKDARYDESHHAAAVARHLGTDHTELVVDEGQCQAVLPQLANIYDEPFADASQIPTLVLSRLTRRYVTVGLSGDGGDELFGGYDRYRLVAQRWHEKTRLPRLLRKGAGLLAASPAFLKASRSLGRLSGKLNRRLEDLGIESPERLYRNAVSLWRDGDGLMRAAPPPTPFDDGACAPNLPTLPERFMWLDAQSYLPDDLLVKIDRASMAASLEARAPLLDHRIAEFSWSLPLELKIRERRGKWILRQVLYKRVPRELVERPKQGFEVPVGPWLRGPLRDWAEDLLSAGALSESGLIDPKPVLARWREHVKGRRNWTYPLWIVLMLQAWLKADAARSVGVRRGEK
jgi:asparagine synthase (glutamine-hydrolysing)